MKSNILVSALFTAAAVLTPAHASSVLFTSSATMPVGVYGTSQSFSLTNGAGSLTAYGFDGIFSTTAAPATVSVNNSNPDNPVHTATGGSTANLDVTSHGLGLASNDTPYIGPTDGIVLDFSNVKTSVLYGGQTGLETKVTLGLTVDVTGPSNWTVYGYNTTGVNAGKYSLLASGPMQSGMGQTYVASPTFSTTTLYSNYLVGVTSDCALTITGIQVEYDTPTTTQQTPEPGTFVMGGMALIGLGVMMKKRASSKA